MPQKGRLLLIDDEETFLQSTAELLRQNDYACDEAPDAHAAVDRLQEHTYDLVIADIKMPGNADLELVEQLSNQTPELPVILVTGYPSMETAVDSINLNVHAYLVKPFDIEELLEHVNEAVEQRQTAQLVDRIQERARRRVRDFDRLHAAQHGGTARDESPVEPIFEMIFQDVAEAYIDLRQLCAIVENHRPEALSAMLRNDPQKQQLAEALHHAIEVIEETKKAFKSKQLAELRRDLEKTLEEASYS